ncbi:glycosyltransferase [Flavobacterium algicola]|uniref:glycosyltransferase n=1 Tax=Flavobacterium algicola TaxID=556529 RepID=UPI001EFE65E2|nr:glycosyltransferase [Flavobacterium algicola]MCG9793520.1 glycosyltransferase [Flavobacterium algicola]
MNIVFFTHPSFLSHQSMPRYASMLKTGMEARGHQVIFWSPAERFYKLSKSSSIKKWLSYVDQYLIFPIEVRLKLRKVTPNTLFVFADQALGPWVPLVSNRKHIVHCHDFLALKSALGQIPENPTSATGKLYQDYIRKGFSKGKNFISISQKTEQDLKQFHLGKIEFSRVCYNGLSRTFNLLDTLESRALLSVKLSIDTAKGYIMHIGGNQYYKNRKGVIAIYDQWRMNSVHTLPLLLIGERPSTELEIKQQQSVFQEDIHFISNLEDNYINIAYSGASCLLFPSLDEGFGWPIIEAMASGTPVITVNKAPMNEVGGAVANYIEPIPSSLERMQAWATDSATVVEALINQSEENRIKMIEKGVQNIQQFTMDYALDRIEEVYIELQ